jgi:type II restriction/modification system DNA methylase subunit YeeA
MPDDLLSGNSILAYTREAMTPDACEDVEVIGWLYQFYISEKKDEVFDGLKKNKKITPENIPAATQLFTPHWIVRYLVENSLGRLWMLNRPDSRLIDKMDYYIKPEQPETDFLRISKPEEIKFCDPACGSGHMITYGFDLLYFIYEEEGYEPAEIPEKILTHNLYGIEIDERAGELAAFALTMKARAKQRRFFSKGVKPNICVLENVHFDEGELKDYMDFIGRDLFTAPLQTTLHQFEEADNFGSLIRPAVTDVDGMLKILESKNVSGHLFLSQTHQKVLQALLQAEYLSPKYHVVIANPPYMGRNGMNTRLKAWTTKQFVASKADLFSMFTERSLALTVDNGYSAMVTIQNWMFLSSFEDFRTKVLQISNICTLLQIGFNSFPELNSKFALASAFILNRSKNKLPGVYINLNDAPKSANKNDVFVDRLLSRKYYLTNQNVFKSLPSCPIAYWITPAVINAFNIGQPLGSLLDVRQGMATTDNNTYLRNWTEISINKIGFHCENAANANSSGIDWFPYNKGGDYRKWYGNNNHVILYKNDGQDLIEMVRAKYPKISDPEFIIKNRKYYFRPSITWSFVGLNFGVRYSDSGFIFDVGGSSAFIDSKKDRLFYTSFLCCKLAYFFMQSLNPSLNFQVENVQAIPMLPIQGVRVKYVESISMEILESARNDWNSYETSWDFTRLPLLNPDYRQSTLEETYQKLRAHWREMTLEMRRLEEENNRIFIEAYGLQDELTPEVPLNEITLTCNPHYRYGGDKSDDELEALLLADTIRELISYAVGCMFGRYALDKPGLILANQGETIGDYYKKLTAKNANDAKEDQKNIFGDFSAFRGSISFPADEDNVIPLLDGDWFTDDISDRFREFLKVAFGAEHYEENLRFVEQALGKNGKARDIRDYFLKDFYSDHVRRYKKRPIYWLFSSPKGSFNALIYMHRYRPDTVSVVLNGYLREFRTKLTSHKNHLEAVSISASASQGEKTKALKDIEKVKKMIAEMEEYEREVLYPLATEQIAIDLDDGVKVNYPKFGSALKKIAGLDATED